MTEGENEEIEMHELEEEEPLQKEMSSSQIGPLETPRSPEEEEEEEEEKQNKKVKEKKEEKEEEEDDEDIEIGREFEFGKNARKAKFGNNYISTTRYTLLFKFHKNGLNLFEWIPILKRIPKIRNMQKLSDLPWLQFPFIVQAFLEQFLRVANIYFLIIILLQLIPGLSPTGRFSTLFPFSIVTIFTMLKEGFEDMKRYFSDLAINKGSKATIWNNGKWEKVQWRKIVVGDIVKCENRERFPCDLIALSSSQENGLLYVETSSLDGETNLKLKTCHEATTCINDENVGEISGNIECEAPNKSLYTFSGNVLIHGEYWWTNNIVAPRVNLKNPLASGKIEKICVKVGDIVNEGDVLAIIKSEDFKVEVKSLYDNVNIHEIVVTEGDEVKERDNLFIMKRRMKEYEEKKLNMSDSQQILRGSSLRNTKWMIGIAIFTGHDTKLMMNQKQTPKKQSKVERMTNKLIYIIFVLLILLSLMCAIGTMITVSLQAPKLWYIKEFQDALYWYDILYQGFAGFWTFLILFNNLVPISLYVSVEMAKFVQGYFMSRDISMYYGKDGEDIACTVRSSSINEELGTVEYIFSDKTGTLTCNKMDFLKFGVNGNVYGTGITEIERSNAKRKGLTIENDRPEGFDEDQDFRFYDGEIMTTNEDGSKSYNYFENANLEDSEKITEFFKLLALCHTVIPEKVDGKVKYTSSSPDEEALVKAARELGLEFINRTTSSMTIKIHGSGKEETYTLLNILEFTSTRKRMSVIVRTPEGKLKLLIKGADNVIYERLAADSQHSEKTLKNLEELAEAGLRTLVCAETDIDEEFYVGWNKKFQEALEITDVKIKEKKLEVINAEIEKDLYLVGITAIEDKLQSGVPNTIAELKKGQIKIWVLTGDKQETAKNIGFACDLLNTDMELIELSNTDPKLLSNELENAFFKYKDQAEDIELGLVVDGKKLLVILEDEKLKYIFLKLGTLCSAVVCCRVSPSQKADVVLLVKKNMETITLAIGDGANDVAMIQSAHVGIGIAGKEGLQAANSSDYSFGQFRFLKPLLLIHGRYNYRRVSKIILYSFYKNIVLYITQMWFVFFNAFTGTSVHDKWTVSAYNVFFTFLPIMALGIWDRDISREKVYMFPQLYARGQQNVYFNFWNFLGWVLNAVWHSAVCFFIPMLCLYFPNIYGGLYAGSNPDMYSLGLAIYTSVLLTVTLKAHLEMSSYSFWQIASSLISLALWWLFIFAYGSFYYIYPNYVFLFEETYNILEQWKNMLTLRFYATVLLTTMIACIRDIIHKAGIRFIIPNLYYAVQDTQFYAIQKKLQDPTLDLHEKDILKSRFKRMKEKLINDYPMKQTKPKFTSYAKKMMKKAGITNTTSSSSHRIEETPSDNKNNEEKHHRGFAFSQTENQKSILDMYYKMKKRSTL
eukprot:CAMPEP_0117423110 /NCGR_PEP_ID=MMETSP0758-20121206/3812_1 /TAXON_ID=63605 /ORGANISM="Percolomonas cosmopolitus, Strain AE-1 (ATCC 50343)" /LENGTH=1403 /DNA_ID=CAMNT_0005206127 /DNA_START=14 /DNA_END=4225 /DNA_ORIENTATION=+